MTHRWIVTAATLVALLPTSIAPAQAATVVIDVTGIQSFDALGDSDNTILTTLIGTNSHVTGLGWDVELFADAPSWLSEAAIMIGTSSGLSEVTLTVGIGDDFSGTQLYSSFGIVDLIGLGLDFNVEADGILRLEFHETFNDFANEWDAQYLSGNLTFRYDPANTAVPEPATWAMMLLGFGAIGFAMRRRRQMELTFRRAT